MAVPIGYEIEYEGEVYILVDSALLMMMINPDYSPCRVCALRGPCGVDCIIDGPEVGVYVKKLEV